MSVIVCLQVMKYYILWWWQRKQWYLGHRICSSARTVQYCYCWWILSINLFLP